MSLPTISHLQAAILNLLADANGGEAEGMVLAEMLKLQGAPLSPPAFYQAMGRMKAAGLVTERKDQRIASKQIIRKSIYRATPEGHRLFIATLAFYRMM
jgi:DNA-binding PadR family transcriptional regulator